MIACVITGMELRAYLEVLVVTHLYCGFAFLVILVLLFTENHWEKMSCFWACLENLKRISFLLDFKLFIRASLRHWLNDLYSSWKIIRSPVFKTRSSISLSTFVIIGAQYGTACSTIHNTCIFRTSNSSV